MLKHAFFTATVVAFVTVPASMAQADGVTPGSMLSNSCAGCHGTDGKSPGSIPSIQGKSPEFFVKAMQEFREGTRASTVMGRHAKGYTDQEIDLIAKHFGKKE